MEILLTLFELPLWLIIALPLAGAVVGMFFLTLAILLLGHSSKEKELKVKEVREDRLERTKPSATAVGELESIPETGFGIKMTGSSKLKVHGNTVGPPERYKPVPPVRQHYWYYVSGVSGRFATLRETLSASGVKVPTDKLLDWNKLSSDTRDRIKRVRVVDKQPLLEPTTSKEAVQAEPGTIVRRRYKGKLESAVEAGSESVIRKSIGDGAFVTIKKKSE